MGAETAGVAAAMARARRRVISHFMSRNAVSSANAVAFEPARWMERRFFDGLRDAGVIVSAAGGKYWIDVAKWDAYQQARRKRIGIGLGIGAAIIGAGVAIGLIG